MAPEDLRFKELQGRLDSLERRNQELVEVLTRPLRENGARSGIRGVGGVCMGLLALFLVGARFNEPPTRFGVIEAEEFLLRDGSGKTRGKFTVGADGSPRFLLNDAEGQVRLQMSVGPNGTPGLRLLDEQHRAEIGLAVSPGGRPGIVLNDRGARNRANLSLLEGGSPSLTFRDAAAQRRMTIESQNDGTPGLSLRDAKETMRLSLVVLPGGIPGVNLFDAEGFPRGIFHSTAEGDTHLKMFGKNRQELFNAPPGRPIENTSNR